MMVIGRRGVRGRAWRGFGATASLLFALVLGACQPATQPAAQQQALPLKVGYLHTVAVDAHMWLAEDQGYFKQRGLQVEMIRFNDGPSLMQALTGGSLDVAVMGAVISNFPSRGQGKVFLLNDIEYQTAQLWVRPESGIKSIADLKGKQIATTRGTTANVFLYTALKKAGLTESDVEIVNSAMPGAVNAFIGGAVPAVATWVPFQLDIQQRVPGAQMLDNAGNYYPEAAIVGGWVARNDLYEKDKERLNRLTLAWLDTNKYIVENSDAAMRRLHQIAYSDLPLESVTESFKYEKVFPNEEWATYYRDGTAAKWIGQVEQVFVDIGAFDKYVDPKEFFDSSIYLNAYAQWAKK